MTVSQTICIDVGSHNGADAIKLYSIFSTKVYGFEPHPRFFALTTKNCSQFSQIEILPFAVSDKDEKFVILNESRGDMSHSILPFKSEDKLNKYWPNCGDVHPSGHSFRVPMTRLDTFLKSRHHTPDTLNIAYLHVDAQGVDLEVLKSLGEFLPCIKTGVVEAATTSDTASYEGQQGTLAVLKKFLEENGFKINATVPYDTQSALPCEQNIFFSRL